MHSSRRGRILNLGVVAHVDAGKTTLTEQLLYQTGVTDHVGSVDHGDTQTDTDDLERKRGITIRSAVVAFRVGDVHVNLIDTPGHSDFVAEVERALTVLDGAVLVVSAVEGVQAQTRVLIRILERLEIPFLVFVNKMDRMGAAPERVMAQLRTALTAEVVKAGDDAELAELLAEHDDDLMTAYVAGATPPAPDLRRILTRETLAGRIQPVLFGSANTGQGIPAVLHAIADLAPVAHDDPGLHGTVFKIHRDANGRRVAFARLDGGRLAARDGVSVFARDSGGHVTERTARLTAVARFERGAEPVEATARPGDIAVLRGLDGVQIGDQLGRWDPRASGGWFAAPGLESVVHACPDRERPALYAALQRLAEQDPLINVRLDGPDDELTVSLYGEVQKEVLTERLRREFGVTAEFAQTQTVYVERLAGSANAEEAMGPENPFQATLGFRVEPETIGSGVTYALEVELGSLLLSYQTAIRETVLSGLRQGLYGWQLTDCRVTLTRTGYNAAGTTAADFRQLTPLVLFAAITRAGTCVCEPYSAFEVDFPATSLGAVLQRLGQAGAQLDEPTLTGGEGHLSGSLPTRAVYALEQQLPGLTGGQGALIARPDGHRPARGRAPTRGRTDGNPANRKEYLGWLSRRG